MTLLDAKDFDTGKERKRNKRIISAIVVLVLVLLVWWWNRYWPEKHRVSKFFTALENKDFNSAYGIWMHDPDWLQHPERHTNYPFGAFYRDWGPGGEWGAIKTQEVFGASTCPGGGSGVVVDVVVNGRAEHAQVWVEDSDKTLSFPPCELVFR